MPYPQQPPPQHPQYYPQQPMHPSHGLLPQQQQQPPPPHHGQPPPPPHHQQHIMPPGPHQPHQPPGGYYHQHPAYGQPPPPPHGPPQSMPPPGPYIQYPQHHHYYPHQQPMHPSHALMPQQQPQLHHGQPPPPHHQQHIMPPGPQQPHQPPAGYYHQPMPHPAYGQPPPPHGPPQSMPPPNHYIQYPQHYYHQQPMHPSHGPPPQQQPPHHGQPQQPHHQQHIMPPGPQQPHQPPAGYYHQAVHQSYGQPPPPPPSHPQQSPQQQLSGPINAVPAPQPLPPQSHVSSRAHTPQHPPNSQTPTKMMVPPPISTPASPSTVIKPEKKEITFPKNSVEATKPAATKRRKITSKDVTDIEVWRLLMCLKSGLLAESSWAIDVLSILLNDDSTTQHFGLQHMPGMLEAILEHFKCSLNENFSDMGMKDTTLKPELGMPVNYSHWQEGNGEDTSHIQTYFEPHDFIDKSKRCICISTVLRNLSFIPGNDVEMSKHAGLLLVLGRVLMYRPDEDLYNEFDTSPNEMHLLDSLREDTLVIISNISSSLDLTPYNDKINLSLLKGLLHWACSSSLYALDPFPPPSRVSPQRLALESLAKLSIIEGNVDLILATPPWTRIEKLFEVLTNMLNMNEDQTIREFSLVLLSNLAAADSGIARKVALTGSAIARLVSFLELSIADPDIYATTQDMLRRAAVTLKCLSQLVDNHPLFAQYQHRLLNLVMSKRLDQEVVPIIADVIFEISL